MNLVTTIDGRPMRKSTRSGAGNDCVHLPVDGSPNAIGDSKSGQALAVPNHDLVRWLKRL